MFTDDQRELLDRLQMWSDFQGTTLQAHVCSRGNIHHADTCNHQSDRYGNYPTRWIGTQAVSVRSENHLCLCLEESAGQEENWVADLYALRETLDIALAREKTFSQAGNLSEDTPTNVVRDLGKCVSESIQETLETSWAPLPAAKNTSLSQSNVLNRHRVPLLRAYLAQLDDQSVSLLDRTALRYLLRYNALLECAVRSTILRYSEPRRGVSRFELGLLIAWEYDVLAKMPVAERRAKGLGNLSRRVSTAEVEAAGRHLDFLEEKLRKEFQTFLAHDETKVRLALIRMDGDYALMGVAYPGIETFVLREGHQRALMALTDPLLDYYAHAGLTTLEVSPEYIYFTPNELETAQALWSEDASGALSDLVALSIATKKLMN